MVAEDGRQLEGDLRIALLTGAVGWRDRNSSYDAADFATMAVLASGVAAVVTVLLVSAGLPGRGAAWTGDVRWVAAGIGSLTLATAVAPTLAWPFGVRWKQQSRRLWPVALVRIGAVATVVGCWTVLLGAAAPWPAWVLGSVVGAEVVLTARSLGVEPGGWEWWWRLERSSLHMGILLVSVVVGIARPDNLGEIVLVWLTFQFIAAAIAGTCSGLNALRAVIEQRTDRKVRAQVGIAHDRVAEWLHDEVTTDLRLLRRKMLSGQLSPEAATDELSHFESRLRDRQVEEALNTGVAQLADVVQLYIRQAQDNGVALAEVPSYEVGRLRIDGPAGQLVQRSLAVLVPNAIAAGATCLALRIAREPDGWLVEVEDDAGGFDLASAPAGRGVDRLQRKLGPDRLTCEPVEGGSCMRARIDTNSDVLSVDDAR